jgi:hypothetical protein
MGLGMGDVGAWPAAEPAGTTSPVSQSGQGVPVARPFKGFEKGVTMVGGLIAVLIVIALVLVLLKVAVAGGILGLIAIILLVLLLLGRL